MKRTIGGARRMAAAPVLMAGAALIMGGAPARAATPESVLHAFTGADGAYVEGGAPVMDTSGNIYGTTSGGGTTNAACSSGCGVIYKIAPDGTETVLYAFTGGGDGSTPVGGVVRDGAGNLYGTALHGGLANNNCFGSSCGTVFRLSPAGKFTVLHTFTGADDGANPFSNLTMDKSGNLYGTTEAGGSETQNCGLSRCGTVFKITRAGIETVLYSFHGYQAKDGYNPSGGVTLDASGTIYGTTFEGGTQKCNCGTVFSLSPSGTETVLHRFIGADGNGPVLETPVLDSAGNIYGTTDAGGTDNYGTAFKLSPGRKITTLHSFTAGTDGAFVFGGLVRVPATGVLFGTSSSYGALDHGTAYEIEADGTFSVLHAFAGGSDGASPYTPLLLRQGYLYGGTLVGGGSTACSGGCGTIFRVK